MSAPVTGEFAFIEALRSLPLHPGARGLDDDAAVLEIGGETLVITQDTLVEGVHVLPDWPDAADTAWKLVAVNLSDLAAKGAEPVGVLLSHAVGADDGRFLHGLGEILGRYNVPLLGGDTVATGSPRSWTLTAIGRAAHTPVPSRSGAKPGDALYLCGQIGNAMRGHEMLTADERAGEMGGEPAGSRSLRDHIFTPAYLRPKPKLSEGIALAPYVTAMMDVSDGLYLDADRLAKASSVQCDIDFDAVPFAPEFDSGGNQLDVQSGDHARRDAAMRWGDDYALLFTAAPDTDLPVPATRIGEVVEARDWQVVVNGSPLPDNRPLGYQHGG